MPNDSLNSLTWKAESRKDLKYCSFWGAIICDLISYALKKKKKEVEVILRRRAKWVTKWTFTIGREKKKIHITIKVVNVIQRNMRWVLTGNVWESHLSSFCSLQPKDLKLDFSLVNDGSLEVSCQQGDKQSRKAQEFWSLFWSGFAPSSQSSPQLSQQPPTATKLNWIDSPDWRSHLNKINVNYG